MKPDTSTSAASDRGALRDTLLIGGCQAVSMLVALLTVWLLTMLVPASTFGAFTLLMGALMLVRNSLLAPLFHTIVRFYADADLAGSTAQLRRVVDSWKMRLLALMTAAGLYGSFMATLVAESLLLPCLVFTGLLAVFVVRDIEISWLNASRQHARFSAWTVADAVMKPLALLAVVAVATPDVNALLTGQLLASAAVLAVFLYLQPRSTQSQPLASDKCASQLSGQMFRYLLPVMPLPLLGWVAGMSDRYIIGWTLDLSQVGLYAAVYSMMSAPFLMLDRVAMLTFQARYFKQVASGRRRQQRKTMLCWLALYLGCGTTGLLVATFASEDLERLLLAAEYRQGITLMPWIAGGNLLLGLSRIFEAMLHAQKKPQFVLLGRIAGAVAAGAVTLWLVLQAGLLGAAIACPVYFAVQCVMLAALSCTRGVSPNRLQLAAAGDG